MQNTLQATINEEVKSSLLTALNDCATEPDSTDTLLQLITTLTNKVDSLTQTPSRSDINPRTGKKFKCYCWSCGYWTHWGKDCTQKKSGHKGNATFCQRLGVGNKNCLPTRDQWPGDAGPSINLINEINNKLKTISFNRKFAPVASTAITPLSPTTTSEVFRAKTYFLCDRGAKYWGKKG